MNLLNDKSGKTSAMRLAMLLWTIGVLGGWLFVSYTKAELQTIPESVVGILAILVGGKVTQRFGENKDTPTVTIASS